jgi:hypothetical protein
MRILLRYGKPFLCMIKLLEMRQVHGIPDTFRVQSFPLSEAYRRIQNVSNVINS